MTMCYTNKCKRAILEKINVLSSTEHEEILKIVKRHDVSFSQNKNGVFFNLSMLSDTIIQEIDNFVTYCISNKKELDEYDKIINQCKMNNKIDGVMPVISTSLTDMAKSTGDASVDQDGTICSSNLCITKKNNWTNVKMDAVSMEKFMRFAEKVAADKEKVCKKRVNVKFNNAKKRFAKKVDRKFENDIRDDLSEEPYLILKH